MGHGPFLLLPTLVPFSSITIGSLVPSLSTPHVDAFTLQVAREPGEAFVEDRNVTTSTFASLTGSYSDTQNTKLLLALTQLINLSYKPGGLPNRSSSVDLQASTVKRYELTTPRKTFQQLCQNEEARLWLEDGLKAGEKSYLLVGAMTVTDANITEASADKRSIGVGVTVPIGEALGVPGIVDPGVGVERGSDQSLSRAYSAPGEMVWAVACKTVRFQAFKKKSMDTAYLDKKIRWEPLSKQRSTDGTDDTELAVDLEDNFDENDLSAYDQEEDFLVPTELGIAQKE